MLYIYPQYKIEGFEVKHNIISGITDNDIKCLFTKQN